MIYETSFNGGKDRSKVIVMRQVEEFGETDSEPHTTAVKTRRSEPIQVDFNCHQGTETNMVVITKEKMRVKGDIKSLDFISWSDSGEGIGKLGINTLFASNSSLISNDPPIKAGEEIILKVTIVGHQDTADGGLTSGHIRSLDVNNDCVARGSDEQLGDYRAAGSMACVIKDKVTTENC